MSVTPTSVHHRPRHSSRRPASALATASSPDPNAIIEALSEKAGSVLGAALHSPLAPFQVGALGNFPYYWQNPANLDFNHLTYEWIDSHLAPNPNNMPAALEGEFTTDEYEEVLAAIVYSLSTADQQKLNKAQQAATNQQVALLNAWQQAYGSIPAPTATQQPIDIITSTIALTWAEPPTTLQAIQSSTNLRRLLNNTPASGQPILPVLASWLNAIGSSVSLQDASTMNNAYLQQALAAVQNPTKANGALPTDDGNLQPAFAMAASSQVSNILNGLQGTAAVNASMTVVRTSDSDYTVSLSEQASFDIPVDDFIDVSVQESASYFSQTIATSSNTVHVTMNFPGVTLVNFGPVPFDSATGQSWYWMLPITDAIANGSKDVTGFKFSLNTPFDFSTSGPFGFLTGVAISNYPTITIEVTSSDYESINKVFQSQVNVGVNVFGFSMASGSASSYSNTTTVNADTQTVTITLNPPPDLVAGTSVTSTGWILGVQTEYPAAAGN